MKKIDPNEAGKQAKNSKLLNDFSFIERFLIRLAITIIVFLHKRIEKKHYVIGFILYQKSAKSRREGMGIVKNINEKGKDKKDE